MPYFRNLTTILLFIIIVSEAKAQTLKDPIYLNFSFFPASISGTNATDLSISSVEANLGTPVIKIGNKIQLINILYYRNSRFDFQPNNSIENETLASDLHDVRYSAVFRVNISKRVEFLSINRILIRSDLKEDINSDDFFPFLIALGNYSIGGDPNFTIGVGVALTSDFRYNALIPIAALRYESEKTKLEIVYPNLNLLYKKSPNLEFGLFGNVDGAISNVQGNSFDNTTIQYQRNLQVLIAPTVSFRIFKQIFGHLKAGIVPISNIQALDGSFQKIDVLSRELDPHFFVRSGISLRLNN